MALAEEAFAADIAAVAKIEAVPTILDTLCRLTGMGFAAVARVTQDRWIVCAVRDEIAFGLQPGGELEVSTTICDEIRDSGRLVVIDHVAEDPAFCGHHTPLQYGFQSYISVPIRRRGQFFGTLCSIDPRPARLRRQEVIDTFTLFAELIGMHLDLQDRAETSEAALFAVKDQGRLRDQFIAVLGHDLRNPLASISAARRILMADPTGPDAAYAFQVIEGSVDRMAELIDNVLDFARGRLGDGLPLELNDQAALDEVIDQVVEELRATHPGRRIETSLAIGRPVPCDPSRLGQLLSNLIGNALQHGTKEAPVRVAAATGPDAFTLSVSNAGPPIAPELLGQLFQPFFRSAVRPDKDGLGLGLFIAAEIAKAHGGQLTVASDATKTCFTLRIPA